MMIARTLLALALSMPVLAAFGEEEARNALVVGCDYPNSALALPSPARDAQSVAVLLKDRLGFEVTLLLNPTRKELLEGIDKFGEQLGKKAGVGLFYFSGHGAQYEGENFLIPTRANLGFREDLPTEAIAAQRVVTRMENAGNRVNLLFLDACRNNPLPSSRQKSALARGLAGMNAANGMLIGFATARNTAAVDSGEGSLYTNALLRHMVTPGLSVTDMLTRVNAEVRKSSGGTQVPFMESGLSDVYALAPGSGKIPEIPPPAQAPAAATPATASKARPFVNSLGMQFVPVPGTKILMCRTETRVADFRQFAKETGFRQTGGGLVMRTRMTKEGVLWNPWEPDKNCSWENPGFDQNADHPVTAINWNEAQAFCRWLSKKEGRTYRLPTDAEWSAAVNLGKYPWGHEWPPRKGAGNFFDEAMAGSLPGTGWGALGHNDGAVRTAATGGSDENSLGLYDLGGNVWEFCEDKYRASMNGPDAFAYYAGFKEEKTKGGTPMRVLRGASYGDAIEVLLRSAFRAPIDPSARYGNNGIRVVLEVGGK